MAVRSLEARLLNVTVPGGFEGFYPPGGRERAGSNTVAGPQRTGCRSPLEHGGPVRHQDRGPTARGVVTPERGRVTRAVWRRLLTPRAAGRPALVRSMRSGDLAAALKKCRSDDEDSRVRAGDCSSSRAGTWVSVADTLATTRLWKRVRARFGLRGHEPLEFVEALRPTVPVKHATRLGLERALRKGNLRRFT